MPHRHLKLIRSDADPSQVLHSPADTSLAQRQPVAEQGRLFELDLLRFVAAAAVVVFHLGFVGSSATGAQPSNLLAPVAKYGYLGVDFFFILSGFVITRSAQQRGAASFARARLLRLLPAYIAAIAATSAVLALVGDAPSAGRILANLTFTQRIFSESFIDDAYWSLLVELKFYAIIAVLIAVRAVAHFERFAYLWLAGVIGLRMFGGPGWLDSITIVIYAHLFIAGIIFSMISTDRIVSRTRGVALALCLAIGLYQAAGHASALGNDTHQYSSNVAASATVAFFALFTLIALHGIPILRRPAFAALGAASYPLYLLHQEIGYRVFDAWNGEFWIMFPTVVVAVAVGSHLISSQIEAPFSRWMKGRRLGVTKTSGRG